MKKIERSLMLNLIGFKKITDETSRLFNDEKYHVEYYNNN